jgi:hypothetical protein
VLVNPRDKILNDLIGSSSAAKTHFDVLWAQVSEARPKFLDVMNEHGDFFRASYHAHYTAFFVHLAHLFDPRKDSSSITTYFSAIRATTDPVALSILEAEYADLHFRAQPLIKARHKTVAHVDAALKERDLFAQLNITWNEIRSIIYAAAEFVAKLASQNEVSAGIPRDGRLFDATLRMIRALQKQEI